MRRLASMVRLVAVLMLIFGIYIVAWWVAVFNGYYDELMTDYQQKELLCYLPADGLLAILVAVAVVGIRRKREWGFWAALLVSGGLIYAMLKVIVMFFVGLLPNDILTHLALWPYFVLGIVAVPLLWKLKRRTEA